MSALSVPNSAQRPLCVALHDYRTDPALSQKDGVNLAHENIAAVLREAGADAASGLSVRFHDLNRLLADEANARTALVGVDCVVSNVGPHAHHYFALRDRLGGRFAIVRDVRTAMWSSYLLQEQLCAPLLRDGDVLLVASHYTQALYQRLFPHLRTAAVRRCYPLTVGFPQALPSRPPRHGAPLVLGYLGRLSEDKNFPDLVELVIQLNEAEPAAPGAPPAYRLLACGEVHSATCEPARVRERLAARLGREDAFEHLAARPNAEVWAVLARMDVMLFPSTSNLETLGRVLIEAGHAGVPVLCAEHAAAPELVPGEALVPVRYQAGRRFDTHYDHSLGHCSVPGLVQAVRERRFRVPECHHEYAQHAGLLLELVRRAASGEPGRDAGDDAPPPPPLHRAPQAFIDSLEVTLPPLPDRTGAMAQIETLRRWFLVLQQRGTPERAAAVAELQRLPAFPERTERFIARSSGTRCDFTNVGGIDIELCKVLGFFPGFTLRVPAGE